MVTNTIKKIIPKNILNILRPPYHFMLSFLGALIYRFPSRKINVIAVTGTKGKSTVTELVASILEEAGFKTALANTLQFKIGKEKQRNLYKMTMPGRFFLQKFLRHAVNKNCLYAVIEMTSEGAKQFRHKFIDLNALIFTHISPEHIESHGSYENYLNAKLSIAKSVSDSPKRPRILVVNNDDKEASKFLDLPADLKIPYSLNDLKSYNLEDKKIKFEYKNHNFNVSLPGLFNVYNSLAAIKFAEIQNIPLETIKRSLEKIKNIRGRVEFIECGQKFDVVVDYAHTVDSLEKFYKVFEGKNKICILGNTGGGRDTWKRPEMAKVADKNCDVIILTNEDPYDEDPEKIINEMAVAVSPEKLKIIMDRRSAIKFALKKAKDISENDSEYVSVLITGKGTDPYIMGKNGSKTPWDDAEIAQEELQALGYKQKSVKI